MSKASIKTRIFDSLLLLRFVVAATVAESSLRLALAPSPIRSIGLGVTIALSAFLLMGSRVVWVLMVAGSVLQLAVPATTGVMWQAVMALVILGCLLARGSREFVWKGDHHSDGPSRLEGLRSKLPVLLYKVTAPLVEPRKFATRKVIGRLLMAGIALFFLAGIVDSWRHGSGQGSMIVFGQAISWRCSSSL